MGMFNTVLIPCPQCGKNVKYQSKAGSCSLKIGHIAASEPADAAECIGNHDCPNCMSVFEVRLTCIPQIIPIIHEDDES